MINNKSQEGANPFKCILRNLTYLLGLIDVAFIFYNKEGRRLGDYIANTNVVNCM